MAKPLAQMKTDVKDERVLILTPTGRDATLTQKIFREAGISCSICTNIEEFCCELEEGAGAALMTEEALTQQAINRLLPCLEKQPAWSDIPVILFATNSESAGWLLHQLGQRANIIVLERPINISILTGAVHSALRARRRQYQTKSLLLELEEADRQKDLFLATISHELRTPLNAILGWAGILRSGSIDENTAERGLLTIERNARAQSQLIEDILDMSRIIRGNLPITTEPFDIIPAITAAIDVVRPAAQAKRINIETMLDADVQMISGDSVRFQQIVWNLLSNAIKFTPDGGKVRIELIRHSDHIDIQVSDTGKGISAEFLPHVFDYFRQADNSITRNYGGLGLGLAIVRHLVELHGGTVCATSAGAGKGATFTITLPVTTAANLNSGIRSSSKTKFLADKKIPAQNAFPMLKGFQILVVDDAVDTRELMIEILTQYGANIIAAQCVTEALELLERHQFDLLISDIEMPNRDGYSLIQEIRAKEVLQGRKIPAVALTAHTTAVDRLRAFSAGYDAHIAKPVEIKELLLTVSGFAAQVRGRT
jgi:signal transduction histidine kinase/ActR/RegA family two-component response regulator